MARLIGEAARAWLAQNPNASYTDNISGQTIARQKSGIEKLLAGITQPFRGGAGVAQEFGLTLADIIRMAQGKDTVKRPDKYALLSQEESETLKKDPLKFGLKSGAGVASYGLGGVSKAPAAITALGRIGQAAGKGALAGTAGGFAYSDEGEELSDTLKGGALGGLLGGALQGVGEGVRAIKGAKLPKTSEFGLETRGKAIGLDANKLATSNKTSVTSSTQGKQVIRDYFDDMDTLGLPTHTSEIASTSSDKALAKYGDEFKGLLGSADSVKTFTVKDTNKIISNIEKGFINNPKIAQNAQYQELLGDLRMLGNNYSPSALNTVREKARELINWSSTNNAAVSQRATSQVFDVIDDFFKNSVPGSKDLLAKMKNIYTVRPFFQAKAPGAGSIKVGTASTNVAVPSFGLQERVPEAIGRGLQGSVSQGMGTSSLLDTLIKGGQRAIPGVIGATSGEQQVQQGVQPEMQVQDELNPINIMLAQGVLSGQISSSEANAVLSLLGMGGGGKKSDLQRKAESALTSINTLEGILQQGGNNVLLGQLLPLQGGNSQAQIYNSAATDIMDTLARLRTGAVINEEEEKMYRGYIPKITDTPERRAYKLQLLRQVFGGMANSTQTTDTNNTDILQTLGLQ